MSEHEPRIHCPEPLSTGSHYSLTGDRHHHVARVLRLKAGDRLTVFDGNGGEYSAIIEDVRRASTTLATGEFRDVERESPLHIRLAQGIGRGERTDFAIQKAVELGVASIVPLLTTRGVVRLDARRAERRRAHWQGIIVHACQQCGRNRLPPVHPVVAFEEWLQDHRDDGLGVMLDSTAGRSLEQVEYQAGIITVLVGPEGGLDDRERDAAYGAGFQGARLGPRVLRTETAAIAAVTAIQSLWGDL